MPPDGEQGRAQHLPFEKGSPRIPNHKSPAKDNATNFYPYEKFKKKEVRLVEGGKGRVGCKQNLPSSPLIRKAFLNRDLLVCWQTAPKTDFTSPVAYLLHFSSTEFVTF